MSHSTQPLKVGLIGVHAERGWAREAHVPAIQALAGIELAAVATRTQATADQAAAAFGVRRAYGDPADLIADPDIDLVAVAAPVPAHRDLILAALAAGKHVLTEWPVGISTAQAAEVAAAGRASRGRTAVSLQARQNPAAICARALVASGAVGRVLGVTVYSSTTAFGRRIPDGALSLERPETGMNLTTIQTAHTLDLTIALAGRLTSLAALTATQYPELAVGDPPRPYPRTLADHVLVHGRLAGGGTLAVEVVGGRSADDTPFRLEVLGQDGVLTLEGGAPRGFQAGVLRLTLNGARVDVTDPETAALPDAVVNVAGVYAALRDDIARGTDTVPSAAHALRLARLIDDVRAAAADGQTRTSAADWPC